METQLHRALKERYGTEAGGRSEARIAGFRIDAVTADGLLIEVQSRALAPLRPKLARLLPDHRVRVVKPVVLERQVVRRVRPDGRDLSSRRSPWRGGMLDVFDDLIGIARIFPHRNLTIEVLGVAIVEIRIPRRRRPGYAVVDRRLDRILGSEILHRAVDIRRLLPADADLDGGRPFTTRDLSRILDRPLAFAQRVAYFLRSSGAATSVGKRGNHRLYTMAGLPDAPTTHADTTSLSPEIPSSLPLATNEDVAAPGRIARERRARTRPVIGPRP